MHFVFSSFGSFLVATLLVVQSRALEAPEKIVARAPSTTAQKYDCARSVFAEIDSKDAEQIKNSFAVISSLPYAVETLEKREKSDLLIITYRWPVNDDQYATLHNPQFSARVFAHLDPFKPKRKWTELFSKYCY